MESRNVSEQHFLNTPLDTKALNSFQCDNVAGKPDIFRYP